MPELLRRRRPPFVFRTTMYSSGPLLITYQACMMAGMKPRTMSTTFTTTSAEQQPVFMHTGNVDERRAVEGREWKRRNYSPASGGKGIAMTARQMLPMKARMPTRRSKKK